MMRSAGLRRAVLRGATAFPGAGRLSKTIQVRAFATALTNSLVACVQERMLPPFERIQIVDILPTVKDAAADYTRELRQLEATLTDKYPHIKWDEVVVPLELQSDPLGRMWGIVGHLMSVRNSDDLRKVHEELQQLVIQTFTEASQSKALYDAYQAIVDGPEWAQLTLAQQRVIELSLRSAKLSGLGLEGDKKEKYNKLKLRAAELSTKFSTNLLDATKSFSLIVTNKSDLYGLPDSLLQMFSQSAREDGHPESTAENGPWRITLDPPSYVQFMKYAANRSLREQLHRASITRASTGTPFNNEDIILEILQIRQEMAELLGYNSFAEVSLAKKMAPSVEEVEKMHEDLRAKCIDMAKEELRKLSEYARTNGQSEPLAPWDLAYWSEQLKSELYEFTDEDIKPYFPLEKVLDGLFSLTSKLFGVTIEAADGQAEVWNKDVRFFNVRSQEGKKEIIAGFFLDPYSRPKEKNGGAWMNVCVDRSKFLGPSERDGLRVPVAYLICNQSPPIGDKPSLMTFREVETLFHEFGHGLQHMLTTVDYSAVAGINGVEWDAVEIPSQMMENFCYDEVTLKSISGHYQTGEELPEQLFGKIKAARNYMVATQMLRQLAFGALDMHLHHKYNGQEPLFDVQRRMLQRYSVMEPLDEDRFLCSFSHIFAGGYAAGYYSYKWAEILSCDAYGAFEDALRADAQTPQNAGALAAHVGRQFRATILARGGGQHPLQVFEAFRGRAPSIVPLLTQYGLAK